MVPMDNSPALPPMLEAILDAARARFADEDWPVVERHLRKAWNSIAHETPWEELRAGARRIWETETQGK